MEEDKYPDVDAFVLWWGEERTENHLWSAMRRVLDVAVVGYGQDSPSATFTGSEHRHRMLSENAWVQALSYLEKMADAGSMSQDECHARANAIADRYSDWNRERVAEQEALWTVFHRGEISEQEYRQRQATLPNEYRMQTKELGNSTSQGNTTLRPPPDIDDLIGPEIWRHIQRNVASVRRSRGRGED